MRYGAPGRRAAPGERLLERQRVGHLLDRRCTSLRAVFLAYNLDLKRETLTRRSSSPPTAIGAQNTLEDLYNLMLADGSSTFDVADSTRIGQLALSQSRDQWVSALAGSNDDAGVRTPSPFLVTVRLRGADLELCWPV